MSGIRVAAGLARVRTADDSQTAGRSRRSRRPGHSETSSQCCAMRVLVAALISICAFSAAAAQARDAFPERIALPDGFAPEGIEIAKGTTFFVGSTRTGAIYAGNLRTGAGRILVQGAAPGTRAATGIE